jgi:uncharacterized protein (DUF427 family)
MPMKQPGPDHPITIAPNPKRVRALWQGEMVAETDRALTLREASYPPVQYIPREDARMDLLQRSEHRTHCPYKGDASYYSLPGPGGENAIWSYEQPYPAMAEIKGCLAFYTSKVTITET